MHFQYEANASILLLATISLLERSRARLAMTCSADRFDGAMEDVFDLQDEVTEKVIAAIAPSVEQAEIERARRKPTTNLSAYDCYLRASAIWWEGRQDRNEEAMRLLRRALEIDPGHSSAMGLLLAAYANRKALGLVSDAGRENAEVELLVRQAVRIGRDDAVALGHTAFAIAYVLRDLTFAQEQIERALTLNPSLASAWAFSGWIRLWSGNPAEAIRDLSRSTRLDPLNEASHRKMALIFYCKETTLYGPQFSNAQRMDPTQVNFVVKDGSFQLDGVYFNGKVYAYETEVAAFVDNAMYKGFVSLKYTGPATAEMTLGMPRFPDTTGERLTTGTCRIQIK